MVDLRGPNGVRGSFLLVAALGSFGGVGAAGSSKAQAGPTAAPTAGATTGAKGTSAPSAPTPGAPKPTTGATAAPAAAAINLLIEGQRKRDLEDLQRQSVVAALAQMKVNVDWREHKLAELTDWRDRIEVVALVHREQGLVLDWRSMTLGELNDIRLRSAKAADLAQSFGVTVDWRLFSWRQLEELRRALTRIQAAPDSPTAEARRKTRQAGAALPPPAPPRVKSGRDTDAITEL